ncbi:MAG: chromosomal replication initiator protein DnaA [Deltaproteobacteria bacterium]|nr:chromosomal replication initiator protein DnaA [Deltaproteobacteria bacterium]
MDSVNLWQKVKENIEADLSPQSFSLWIKPIEVINSSASDITFACPNKFFAKWVQENYLRLIQERMRVLHSWEPKINFKVVTPREDKRPDPSRVQLVLPEFSLNAPSQKRLNPNFTFDQFVTGDGNSFAYSAAMAMALGQNVHNNFLYMKSNTGLGKSHLSHAVGNLVSDKKSSCRVIYITAEDFTNEMIISIKRSSIDAFKEKYRKNCDILVMEDIHFLSGKEKTQMELGYTLDALIENEKKVIFTGSMKPNDIPDLRGKLRSRICSSLVTSIEPPDLTTRRRILDKKTAHTGVRVPNDVLDFLATKITQDIRQLESSLKSLIARSSLLDRPITLDMAVEITEGLTDQRRDVTLEIIQQLVLDYYQINLDDLLSKSRKKNIALPRSVCFYLCRKLTNQSLEHIGRAFQRNHTTILYAINKIQEQKKKNQQLAREIEFLEKKLD